MAGKFDGIRDSELVDELHALQAAERDQFRRNGTSQPAGGSGSTAAERRLSQLTARIAEISDELARRRHSRVERSQRTSH
jgi:hypothetical protein